MSIESNVQSDVVFYNIVVPHDLTARSDKAVQMASSMAHPLRSNILLINVIDPSDWHGLEHADFLSEMMDLARDRSKMLRTVAERLLHADVKFDVCVLFGIAESVILAEARKTGADLMIITTSLVSGVGYPFGGGDVEPVQLKASCPVMTAEVSEEGDAPLAKKGLRMCETHSLKQYCEQSRMLAKKESHRPVYIGYSHFPSDLSGVCR